MHRTSFRDTWTIGLMLFALFFGAGNLVFPAMLGQQAGDHYAIANLGFLITGVGLPLLGTLALGFSGSKHLLDLTRRVHPWFAYSYTTLLYLTIGPLFAMPRTGSVSYEIGVQPLIGAEHGSIALAVFTVLFFGATLLFSLHPARMVEWIGRILTPLLIACIGWLAAAAVAFPLGDPQKPAASYASSSQAFFNGFQEGYLTMDALAAFVFGILVIHAIRARGVADRHSLLLVCLRASVIAAVLLAVIYTSLTYIGASSVAVFGPLSNGGEVLNLAAGRYFGEFGSAVLGIIVLLACLTTSIGLTASCAGYFHQLFPGLSYRSICFVLCLVSALLANAGLNSLIRLSVPVLTILYPLAIMLIFLTFLHDRFRGKRAVYGGSLLLTLLVSLVSGLADTPLGIGPLDEWFRRHLPLYPIGLGWLLPACAGALIGLLLPERRRRS